ncbi:dehydrodolichyl diphosphate synthase complex subunit nus1-like [Gigantopelta aegis]|uniref:dehydrodolichyl diphosphate synthase complex subunit nus1-like n=1 Tax=Gigantopelta aegis TaxID=1735272 RepID=UPI001B887C4A|nr:dehydrodolichyl diphosphate synthase complex subunit nus1-like [Gigantopelta aegis]
MLKEFVLTLVHYVLCLGVFLRQTVTNFPNSFGSFFKKAPLGRIRSDARNLKKLPLHVGLVIVENEYSYRDIANVIIWSVALGISYISVYDINGEIKRNYILLQKEIQTSKEEILASEKLKYDIEILSSNSRDKSRRDGGCSNIKQVKVNLLCEEDGKPSIIKVTKQLCRLVQASQYRIEDIVPNNVDSFFQDLTKFPDPDVVIKFGPVDSLLGFLPWQIRLTGILSFPSHKQITYKTFLSTLVSYGHTEQRHGK